MYSSSSNPDALEELEVSDPHIHSVIIEGPSEASYLFVRATGPNTITCAWCTDFDQTPAADGKAYTLKE